MNYSELPTFCKTRSEGFGKEVQRRILLGTYVLSAGYYDAYYKKAQNLRGAIVSAFDEAFRSCDVILAPTVPMTPFKRGFTSQDPVETYQTDICTVPVNIAGLPAVMAALETRAVIALANKETLVCAGELVMAQAERWGADIVPVDSEHSAIFQSLQGCRDRNEVRRLLLTCSGGPFFGRSFRDLEGVTPADALKHPNWSMGAKITIDSATLMNKGLEVIEAMRLYRLPVEQVDVVIHRQSIVHSLVEYRDGAMIAQLGTPDMKLPIRYAFTWPHRAPSPDTPLDLLTCGDLTFRAPDLDAFPCLRIARQCAKAGGTACAIMNGANEAAVALFLQERVGFNDIPRLVESALSRVEVKYAPDLPDILEADRQARAAVLQTVGDMV